ncbi:MAG: hypothetical protein LW710_00265 [Burkholderiales bacterium]|uniref:hypothetical protein n=1 Tax=Limnobacter sp. TaxID=2003368 RepID=UPI0039BD4C70|nr:hypothetical protein [Burkholderiales bacterium]
MIYLKQRSFLVQNLMALVGAVGSAQANSELGKDQIQFMGDTSLSEIQGAKSSKKSMADTLLGQAKPELERVNKKGTELSAAGHTAVGSQKKTVCKTLYQTGKTVCYQTR